ncbi:MAG: hypothetical protein AABZ32_12035 [Bacteroidota bacterium]
MRKEIISIENLLSYFASFIFLLTMQNVFGQEGLLIKNSKNEKAWMYEKNSRITYIQFHEQEYTIGILNALLDSAVVIGKDTVGIKNIAGIRKKNPLHHIARIAGMPLMLIGSLFMGQGAANMYFNPDSDGGIKLFLLGAGVFAVGYIPYELNLEDLTVGFGGEWTIQIYRGGPLPQ